MTAKNEKRPPSLENYQAYLIRIWQDGRQAVWRASAQAVQNGAVVRFASLEELFAFLKGQTALANNKSSDERLEENPHA